MEIVSLRERVSQAMKEAMKSRSELRLSALRMLRAAFLTKDKEGRGEVAEEELLGVVRSQIKQRRESAAAFRQGGREESALKEEQEEAVLAEFLPPAMDEAALMAFIQSAVEELGASGPKEMGQVMKLVREKSGGQADMSRVSELTKLLLSRK